MVKQRDITQFWGRKCILYLHLWQDSKTGPKNMRFYDKFGEFLGSQMDISNILLVQNVLGLKLKKCK